MSFKFDIKRKVDLIAKFRFPSFGAIGGGRGLLKMSKRKGYLKILFIVRSLYRPYRPYAHIVTDSQGHKNQSTLSAKGQLSPYSLYRVRLFIRLLLPLKVVK